jgi:hypothetical protein
MQEQGDASRTLGASPGVQVASAIVLLLIGGDGHTPLWSDSYTTPVASNGCEPQSLAFGLRFGTGIRLTSAYINGMEKERRPFSGKIVRLEPDGFGIVEFDQSVGANTHGVFSTTIGSTVPFRRVKPGMHVHGFAEASDKDLATVKTIEVD